MPKSQIYNRAANLIEKGWVQNVFAEDGDGKGTHPCRYDAESWCLSGALIAAVYLIEGDHLSYCPNGLIEGLELTDDIIHWNDNIHRMKGQVVNLLRNAAARSSLLEEEENARL